jgi:plastocyanin
LIVAALSVAPSNVARAATGQATVKEVGTAFDPRQLTIELARDTDQVEVTFSFVSGPSSGHGVKFDDGTDLTKNCPPGLLNLGPSDCQTRPGQTVSRTLSKGTYPYYCKIHGGPGGTGMAGVIVVSVAAAGSSSTTRGSTTPSLKDGTTSSSAKGGSASSTTATTRALATSSTLVRSTTTTSDTSSVLLPGAPPSFSDDSSSAANRKGDSDGGGDTSTVVLIVALLLAVSAAGGYALWRLRPGRA